MAWAGDVLQGFPSLRGYQRAWLRRDLLAGVTFGAITIPGQLATAHLAGMPPITGLYGFFVACLIGALLSSNRHLAFGVDSTVAPLLAAGLSTFAVMGSTQYIALATATTLLVGLFILVIGLAELGWVGDLLPKPVITGFLGGIAITIVVNQLPELFGLPAPKGLDVHRLGQIAGSLPQASIPTTLIGVGALATLLLFSRLLPRFPTALAVLILTTLVSSALDLKADGVAVLGPLPKGLPPLALPPLTLETARIMLPTAMGIALISLAQTAATSRSVAATGAFEADVARDFRALGAANAAASVVGSFAIDASPPSSTILQESRARTQAAALTAAVLTAGLILLASDAIENLPMSVLAAILIYIATKIFRVAEMRAMLRYSRTPFLTMLGAMIGVVLLGIELGLALTVLGAFLYRAKQVARPELLRLGRTADGQWLPEEDERSTAPSRIAAYRLNGPLWFGNANWFRQRLIDAIGDSGEHPDLLVLDATRIDDVDYTGVDALVSVMHICHLRKVDFAVASHVGRAAQALERARLAHDISGHVIFDSVEAAVATLHPLDPSATDNDLEERTTPSPEATGTGDE
ncbi:MAG: hypothetical protein QG597_3036 [Actinomycetota bacterium]|nr:hypothetical protein [Actinomycetota bacterium]